MGIHWSRVTIRSSLRAAGVAPRAFALLIARQMQQHLWVPFIIMWTGVYVEMLWRQSRVYWVVSLAQAKDGSLRVP